MIYLSQNHKDSIIVEQIAIRLRRLFGKTRIYKESWSTRPGEDLDDKMKGGLEHCKLFLFFVSKNSLQSKIANLDWQYAIIEATKGQARLIPVKVDDCMMPPEFIQTLYIDLFSHGIEIALRQIIDIAVEKHTLNLWPQEFLNLRAFKYPHGHDLIIEVRAMHFLEPNSKFGILTNNTDKQLSISLIENDLTLARFKDDIRGPLGNSFKGFLIGSEKSTIPGFPLRILIKKTDPNASINILGLLHEQLENRWRMVPVADAVPPKNLKRGGWRI